jgi:hypothetical protein
MGVRELLIGAIVLGGVAGYVWSVVPPAAPTYSRPDASVRLSKDAPSPALVEVPPSTEEAAADSAWSAGEPAPDTSRGASTAHARRAIEQSAMYSGCKDVRALGKAPLYAGPPGYRVERDADGDGVACEPVRG